MKLIFRNFIFVLKRFRASSVLNILGLSVVFAVFFVIIVQTFYDFSFDRNIEKADNIYLLSTYLSHSDMHRIHTNTRASKMIAEKLPEVKNYCFMNSWNKINRFDIQDEMGNKHKFDESTIFAHENIIDMFKPQIIAGNARQAFTEPAKAMLTESIAKKFFGTQDPLGKTFSFHIYPDIMITVVAVCKDFPSNCSLTNKQYI